VSLQVIVRAALCGPMLSIPPTAASDVEWGDSLMHREPWQSCLYCHGNASSDDNAIAPMINGQPVDYIRKQLDDYRNGRRRDPGMMMQSAVAVLETADDLKVAEYFSGQSPPSHRAKGHSPGWRLFSRGREGLSACIDCHDSSRPATTAPLLLGQHRGYLVRQLHAFRSGRRNDEGGVMRAVARALSDQEIDALAEALSGHY